MARRYRNTPAEYFFESLVDLASVLPWWSTLPIAILLFIFVPFNFDTTGLAEASNPALFVVVLFLTGVLKYMVPLAFLIGAVINILLKLIFKFKSISLFSSIAKRGALEVINKLSWQDFEFLIAEHFKKQGYATEITGGGGADGGIDVKLYKDSNTLLVQCKHYKASKVSVQTVREFFGIVTAENATEGYVVTSGRFTNDAYSFAQGKNIHLVNGRELIKMLDPNDISTATSLVNAAKVCPECGGMLVQRDGKFGKFLGCDNYPKCKHTEDIN
jgi:restriction system protein